jgi:AMP deaminase
MSTRHSSAMLRMIRIDRYTRAAQSNRNDLTMSNLQPATEVLQTPKSFPAMHPGSPNASMHTHPSASNMAEQAQPFSTLPPGAMSGPLGPIQQARLNQSASVIDVSNVPPQPTSPTSTKEGQNDELHHHTANMTIYQSTSAAPQAATTSVASVPYQNEGESLGLTRTTSSVNLDGEPRIFPGVVSRNTRRSSMRSGAVEDGTYPGYRQGDTGSVAEERDTDDEE